MASMGEEDLCVVLNDDGVVMGLLAYRARETDAARPVAGVMEAGPTTFRAVVPARDLAHYMREREDEVALLTTADGRP